MTNRAPQRVLAIAALSIIATLTASAQDRGLATRVLAPVGPDGAIRELYAGSYALLVGMSHYQDRAAWPALGSIKDELRTLSDALKAHGFDEVQTVMNLTGADLRRTIDDFNGRYGFNRGNRLFYFFSGHGYSLDNGERGYFVTVDAPHPNDDQQGFRRAALSMQQISTWAHEITARHVLFAFDSCFSGTIFRTRDSPAVVRVSSAVLQPVRQFLSAGGANETVPAQSVFTPVLIRGMNGAADIDNDGLVTGTELGNFVQHEFIAHHKGQTPQVGKIKDIRYDEGDIVFARPGAAVVTQPVGTRPATEAVDPTRKAAPASALSPPAGETVLRTAPTDRTAIEQTLNDYRRAYEARNLKQLQLVFPSVPNPAGLATVFEESREVLVGMSVEEIRITSDTGALARVRLNQQFVPRTGSPRTAPTRDVTFTLEKVGGSWLITKQR